jgi:hypothetical protein
MPPGGLRGAEDAAKLLAAVVFPSLTRGDAAGSIYAYIRANSQGTLFPITLP